jgi:hypothetical protein
MRWVPLFEEIRGLGVKFWRGGELGVKSGEAVVLGVKFPNFLKKYNKSSEKLISGSLLYIFRNSINGAGARHVKKRFTFF